MLTVTARHTSTLTEADRAAIIRVCIAAHENEDFPGLLVEIKRLTRA